MNLSEKNVDIESIATKAIKDEKILSEILEGITSDNARIKYGSAKVLRNLAEKNPKVLYPKWDFFVDLLGNENTFLKCDAVFVIGHLTKVDSKNKFEPLFDRFYELLNDKSMITAANLVGVSGIIAKAKPKLQSKIVNQLLSIDKTHHGSECKNVLKGHVINTFSTYFAGSKDKGKILDFMKKELQNTRPATRKKAGKFLNKWDT